MTPEDARWVLRNLRYKRGFAFFLNSDNRLIIHIETADSTDPTQRFVGGWLADKPINIETADQRALYEYVYEHLARFEIHELFENLRISRGVELIPVFAPHTKRGVGIWRKQNATYFEDREASNG